MRMINRENGQAALETLFPLTVIIMLMVVCIAVFSAYANALMAQHALTKTALQVSASGVFTEKQRAVCKKMLPDSAGSDCRVYYNSAPPSNCNAADYCLNTPLRAPNIAACQSDSGLKDCFNTGGSSSQIKSYGSLMRVEVTYNQPWPMRCLPGAKTCPFEGGQSTVTRYVVIMSQTRRSNFDG